MAEDVQKPAGDEPDPAVNDDAELESEVATLLGEEVSKDLKVKNALIAAKKELRAANRKIKEIEPVAARAKELDEKLEKAAPIISAVSSDPRLLAEALRRAGGTPTADRKAEEPEDDPEMAELAEAMGLYLADGHTPDVVRAKKVAATFDRRHGRQTQEAIRPLASTVLGGRAESVMRQIERMTDEDGVPYATTESIREIAGKLPPHLLANPDVANLVLDAAVGLDRRHKRTPKAPDEPVFLERHGGRRVPETTLSAQERAAIERTGLSEKDLAEAGKKLNAITGRRGGVELGR